MGKRRIVSMADYGVVPDCLEDCSSAFNEFSREDVAKCATIYRFVKGTYRFYASKCKKIQYYSYNSQQYIDKKPVMSVEGKKNLIIDGKDIPFTFQNGKLCFNNVTVHSQIEII